MTTDLGQLEQVNLRHAWLREAEEFTPWLAREENLLQLGKALGNIQLELEATEKEVGPFRADILCKNVEDDHLVLIENQLEQTDHGHLGQLLTYAAGLKAATIIWIASRIREEHRAAIDWLNEITDDRFAFFGLEVELWRIGNSPVAPRFNVISKPNDWSRRVAQESKRIDSEGLSEARKLQFDFWTAFREHAINHATHIRPTKPSPKHWMNFSLGRTGVHLSAIASTYNSEQNNWAGHELRAEVVLSGANSKIFFSQFSHQKSEIETAMGDILTWYNQPDTQMCRIYLRRSVDLMKRDDWPEYFTWLVNKLDALHSVFLNRIRLLSLPETETDSDE